MLPALAYARRSWRVFGGADAYAIGGASPELVAAFTLASDGTTAGEYFRKASSETTFNGLFTHSVSEKLTMFDSTGTLVWAPHNLLTYSENLSDASWNVKNNTTVTQTGVNGPTGSATSRITGVGGSLSKYVQQPITTADYNRTYLVVAKAGTHSYMQVFSDADVEVYANFDLTNGSAGTSGTDVTTSNGVLLSDGWYAYTVAVNQATENSLRIGMVDGSSASWAASSTSTDYFDVFCVSVYRSDLGGMADNPDQPAGLEKYVPTTSAAVYLPRRNAYYYNGSAWAKGGLQLESAAATNLLSYSNDFSNASWVKDSVTVAQDATGIDGGTSAFTLTATGSLAYVRQTVTTAATGHTFSIFVKAGTATVFWIYYRNGATQGTAYFDLSDESTQAVAGSSQTPTNLSIKKVGDFYRISANWVATASSYAWGIGICDAKGSTTATTGITGIICASQLETGSIATSYIPTTGSTVTRAAETLSIAGADTPANTTAMSISMKGLMSWAGVANPDVVWYRAFIDGSNNITGQMYGTGALKGDAEAFQKVAGVTDVARTNASYSPGVNQAFSIASRHGSTFVNFAVDGTALTANTTPTSLVDVSGVPMQLGHLFNGFISEFRMWGADIGDSGIAEVTT